MDTDKNNATISNGDRKEKLSMAKKKLDKYRQKVHGTDGKGGLATKSANDSFDTVDLSPAAANIFEPVRESNDNAAPESTLPPPPTGALPPQAFKYPRSTGSWVGGLMGKIINTVAPPIGQEPSESASALSIPAEISAHLPAIMGGMVRQVDSRTPSPQEAVAAVQNDQPRRLSTDSQSRIAALEAALAKAEGEAQNERQQRAATESRVKALTSQIQASLSKMVAEKEGLAAKVATTEAECEQAKRERDEALRSIEEEKRKMQEELATKQLEFDETVNTFNDFKAQFNSTMSQKESALEAEKREIESWKAMIKEHEKEAASPRDVENLDKIHSLETHLHQVEQERDELLKRFNEAEAAPPASDAAFKEQLRAVEQERDELLKRFNEAEAARAASDAAIKEQGDEMSRLLARVEELEKENKKSTEQLKEMMEKEKQLNSAPSSPEGSPKSAVEERVKVLEKELESLKNRVPLESDKGDKRIEILEDVVRALTDTNKALTNQLQGSPLQRRPSMQSLRSQTPSPTHRSTSISPPHIDTSLPNLHSQYQSRLSLFGGSLQDLHRPRRESISAQSHRPQSRASVVSPSRRVSVMSNRSDAFSYVSKASTTTESIRNRLGSVQPKQKYNRAESPRSEYGQQQENVPTAYLEGGDVEGLSDESLKALFGGNGNGGYPF